MHANAQRIETLYAAIAKGNPDAAIACYAEDAYFEDIAEIKVPADMLKLAEHILDSKKAEFDPAVFEDRYETALVELLRGVAD